MKTFLKFLNLIGQPIRTLGPEQDLSNQNKESIPAIYLCLCLFLTLVMLESSTNLSSVNSLKCLRMNYWLDRHFQLVNPELNMLYI